MTADAATLYRDALAARDAGDPARASALLEAVLQLAPAHRGALGRLAELRRASGDAAGAEDLASRLAAAAAREALDLAATLGKAGMGARAAQVLRQATTAHPVQPGPHVVLIDLLRRDGALAQAMEATRIAVRACGDDPDVAARAAALLGEGAAGSSRDGRPPPAPVLAVEDFLPPQRHDEALAYALAREGAAEGAMLETGEAEWLSDPKVRQARLLYALDEVRGWFLPLVEARRVEVCRRLGVEPFDPDEIELQLTAHNDGDFYLPHADRDDGEWCDRVVSFVYYFHRKPRGFEGGGLALYDTDPAGGLFYPDRWTLVTPDDGRIVFFPSWAQHEVRPVRCASRAWADSRFTLNGWLRRRPG